MTSFADVSDMDGKSLEAVLRELAWTRQQRNEANARAAAGTKIVGAAHHRCDQAERALAEAKQSFRGALKALREPTENEMTQALRAAAKAIVNDLGDGDETVAARQWLTVWANALKQPGTASAQK